MKKGINTEMARETRHKLNAVMARVKTRGLWAIDKRTLAAQALLEWKTALIEDLGGPEAVSTQQRTLIELVVRTRLIVEHVDSYLLSQESLVNRKHRRLHPVVRERQTLCDSLTRMMGQLGLERQEKPVKSLGQYLKEREEREHEHSAGDGGQAIVCEDVRTEESVADGEEDGQLG